ncbi:MAG: hypothetical protein Q4P36_07135 [Bowdeniella nasicola]|nr:hypothetical protein [Bowdeniella nasicola]
MSAIASVRPVSVPETRPALRLVRSPKTQRSLAPFILTMVFYLVAALGTTLYLNTVMAVTSYEIRDTRAALVELSETQQTLRAEVEALGSPDHLRAAASEIGMVPAPMTFIMNLEHGSITAVPEVAPK